LAGAVVAEAGGAVLVAAALRLGVVRARVAEAGGAVLGVVRTAASGGGVGHGGAVLVDVASVVAAARAGAIGAAALALLAAGLAALEAALGGLEPLRREALRFLRGEHEGGAALGTGDVLVLMFHGSSRN